MDRSYPVITHMRTEGLVNPVGIDALPPRLSWRMESPRRGARQSAYQIIATSFLVGRQTSTESSWDSGKIVSSQSVYVPYGGELRSRERVEWIVRVWDECGEITESAPAYFEMGLLDENDWQAHWIEGILAGGIWTSVPCPYLRKEFSTRTVEASVNSKPVEVSAARLYITALGVYEVHINGHLVSHDLLNPGWTDYHKRIHYHTYDVTSLIQQGENAIGVILGDGWYCGHLDWRGRQRYGDRPKLLAQLEIAYSDGVVQTIVSDKTWKHNYGPLLEADILMGESYDARREFVGWDKAGFDETGWVEVRIARSPTGKLVAARVPPVRAMQEVYPVSLTRVDDWPNQRWVFDLGQNMVGHVRLKVRGKAGQTVTVRHAEALITDHLPSPTGTLYTVALRSARATDHYTCKGAEEEVWEPRFTFHGFRYVELTGCDDNPPLETVTGVVVHSDLPLTSSFECSNPLLNRLYQNILWSQRGNFLSIPTDCPQRDERLGWTGDILAFMPTAAYNMDVAAFIGDWLRTLRDAQWEDGAVPMTAPDLKVLPYEGGPAWADAIVVVPWVHYQFYGDKDLLAELYPACKNFISWLVANSPNYVRAGAGWQGFGDWIADVETPKPLIGTAYFAHSVDLMSHIAGALGKDDEAAQYRALFEQIRAAFVRHFVLPDGSILSDTQTAYALALQFNLVPDELRSRAAGHLARNVIENGNKLTTGFVGTPHLLFALSENGYLDIAYDLLLQKECPSWLYPVIQGATTIWEHWDSWRHDRGFHPRWLMNSFNHYALGAVGSWMMQVIGGIRPHPNYPGFQHFILNPKVGGGLTYARAEYNSNYGKIISAWQVENGELVWRFVIPANASAQVVTPDGSVCYEAGEYEISVPLERM